MGRKSSSFGQPGCSPGVAMAWPSRCARLCVVARGVALRFARLLARSIDRSRSSPCYRNGGGIIRRFSPSFFFFFVSSLCFLLVFGFLFLWVSQQTTASFADPDVPHLHLLLFPQVFLYPLCAPRKKEIRVVAWEVLSRRLQAAGFSNSLPQLAGFLRR